MAQDFSEQIMQKLLKILSHEGVKNSTKLNHDLNLLARYRARLLEFGIAAKTLDAIEGEIRDALDEATEIARSAPPPSPPLRGPARRCPGAAGRGRWPAA